VGTPKGGKSKAFYIPLSDYLVKLLESRRACGITNSDFPETEYVFPSGDSDSGHIEDPTEVIFSKTIAGGKTELDNISPHDLRHTYSTCAHFAGVNATDVMFLMNHRPKSITVQYMKALLPPLKERQETISKYLQDHLAKKGK
jgi:integrase